MRPIWLNTQQRVEAWRNLGGSAYLCRAVQYGIYEAPQYPFVPGTGEEEPQIPQNEEDQRFAHADLSAGCMTGIYQEIKREHAARAKKKGAIISSAFTVWTGEEERRKGRLVINLSKQSRRWKHGGVRMEMIAEFAMNVQRGDYFISMDIEKGYRHLRLHPDMRDWFIFRYGPRYYRCVALPFGWGRSPLWFTQLMAPFVQELRRWGYRILAYLDDFLIAPSPYGTKSGPEDCRKARERISKLMEHLGLQRHPEKGEWTGATRVEHLGVLLDSMEMKFHVVPHKAEKVRRMSKDLLKEVRFGRRWVQSRTVACFCGTCVALSLAMPWARFYTRSLYWDMSSGRTHDGRGRCRLSHQSVRDLRFWRDLPESSLGGRELIRTEPQAAMHTDAADMGYGGTLNVRDLTAGAPGMWCGQGVWSWQERAESINLRELRAVRMMLLGCLKEPIMRNGVKELLLHADNQSVVHIANSFVSASRPMMRELRRLKVVLEEMGIHIRAEWLPSAVNKFADGLSRRFPRGDLQIRRQLRHSVVDGMKAPLDAFPFRPLGEHPFYLRTAMYQELNRDWSKDEVMLLCPPVDLIGAVVSKLRHTQAPAMLLIPDWPRQPWHQAVMHMANRVEKLDQAPTEIWAAQRTLNPSWRLLMAEVNM